MNRWDCPFPRTGCNLNCRVMLAHAGATRNNEGRQTWRLAEKARSMLNDEMLDAENIDD